MLRIEFAQSAQARVALPLTALTLCVFALAHAPIEVLIICFAATDAAGSARAFQGCWHGDGGGPLCFLHGNLWVRFYLLYVPSSCWKGVFTSQQPVHSVPRVMDGLLKQINGVLSVPQCNKS